MWTTENRDRYNRDGLRYPSDLTDQEWGLIEPVIPAAKRGGRKRTVNVREVVNGIMYVLSTGCQWRYVPGDLPPRSTLHEYLQRWDYDGTLAKIHHALYHKCRAQADRAASPTMGIIDSQTVKGAEKGGPASIPKDMTRGRKSAARSAIYWSTARD
jgi:transposase